MFIAANLRKGVVMSPLLDFHQSVIQRWINSTFFSPSGLDAFDCFSANFFTF